MKRKIRLTQEFSFNNIMFLIFIGIGIVAYIKPGYFINELFIMISIILLLDGICFLISVHYLKINLYAPKMIHKDQILVLKIEVINKAHMPSPYIYIKPKDGIRVTVEKKQALIIMLGSNQFKELKLSCSAKFYGKEQVGLKEVSVKSFIGFFKKDLTHSIFTTIKILPEITHIEYIEQFNDSLILLNKKRNEQSEQVNNKSIENEMGYELNPYIEGDSQRLIHWKIVASRDQYLVRQREERRQWDRKLFLILNPLVQYGSESEQIMIQDKMITTLLSLAAYYINKGQKIEVIYYKDKKWQHINIIETRNIYFLQNILSDYEGIKVENQSYINEIIEELLKMIQKKSGYKLIVSSYWEKYLEEYIFRSYVETKQISMIWTGKTVPNNLIQNSSFLVWHVTDHYELVLCIEKD